MERFRSIVRDLRTIQTGMKALQRSAATDERFRQVVAGVHAKPLPGTMRRRELTLGEVMRAYLRELELEDADR